MRVILLISFVFCTALVEARMYQWVNPSTGTSQLSGNPPAWYRSEAGGPRVLVFENNKLVDDTSVDVTEDQRLELQQRAFDRPMTEAEKNRQQAEAVATLEQQIKAIVESPEMAVYLESPAVQEELTQAITEPAQLAPTQAPNATSQAEADPARPNETSDERVSRLKALISAWEASQTASAKSIVESAGEGETAPQDAAPTASASDAATSKEQSTP